MKTLISTDSTKTTAGDDDLIIGLIKGLRVIESFDDNSQRQTVTEVARRTGLSRAAARRQLLTLQHGGYAISDGRVFWLTPRVLRLGQAYLTSARLPKLVLPFLHRLTQITQESANFAVLDGHEVVYIARTPSPRMMSSSFRVGTRAAAHAVTGGRMLLSAFTPDELDGWLNDHAFHAFTPATAVDPEVLRLEISEAGRAGYAVTDQQLEVGVRGLSVLVRNRKGEPVGALGLTMPLHHGPQDEAVRLCLPALREAQNQLRDLI
ncbi:MAG: helix-turn-helix domain-containing protein [Betaproteobacteria bacterium]|nr:helix-turn-helix domain-containing protein [Betaproteobacteria bacterium]